MLLVAHLDDFFSFPVKAFQQNIFRPIGHTIGRLCHGRDRSLCHGALCWRRDLRQMPCDPSCNTSLLKGSFIDRLARPERQFKADLYDSIADRHFAKSFIMSRPTGDRVAPDGVFFCNSAVTLLDAGVGGAESATHASVCSRSSASKRRDVRVAVGNLLQGIRCSNAPVSQCIP